jgi:hypothetical protein
MSFQNVYARATPPLSSFQQSDTALTFVPGGRTSNAPNIVSIVNTYGTPSYQSVLFAVYNGNNTCFYAMIIGEPLVSSLAGETMPGTYYYTSTLSQTNCSAAWAAANVSNWSNSVNAN